MIEQIIKKIKDYEQIVIFGHIRPDGDCLGAQIGLKNILEDTYKKKVYIVNDKSKKLAFLGETDSVDDNIVKDALVIVVDTANKERISDKRFKEGKEIIRIDHHHVGSEEYGVINYVEERASCCEMLAKMAIDNKMIISPKAATSLYTGIVTDTGGFRHSGTDDETLEIASKLIKLGANPTEIDKYVSIETFNRLRLKGYVISNVKRTDKGFLYCYLPRTIINEYKASEEEASDTLEVMSNVEGCPVWALFIEDKKEIRIRLRSNGPRIDYLANKYEGGGHKFASGAKIHKEEEIKKFCQDADDLIVEYAG